jgi:elongation factor G
LLRYAIDLRSMTSGSATFSRMFARYDPLPESMASQVT